MKQGVQCHRCKGCGKYQRERYAYRAPLLARVFAARVAQELAAQRVV